MFDIGFQELILLLGLGLMVLGPERLPRVVKQIGGWIGKARRMARSVSAQIQEQLDDADMDIESIIDPDKHNNPATYSRPGIDDLKPASSASSDKDGAANVKTPADHSAHGQ